jgi:drug/metabolite transporter (DMT)-like permease
MPAFVLNILLLALVPACFALNPVSGRALADTLGPASLSVIRWAFSALIVALLAFWRGCERWQAPTLHTLRVAVLGMLGMGFCAYAGLEGARTSPATNVALIYSCTAALVAAWEVATGRQKTSLVLGLGIACCMAGVVLVVTRGHPETLLSLRFAAGDLWATAGMLVFVAYTIGLRRTPQLHTALAQFVIMSSAATAALVPFAIVEVSASSPLVAPWMLPWLATLVFVTGIGAFLGYSIALARNGPVLTSAALTLTPVYAAGLAMLLVGEQLGWYHMAAVALVAAGLLLVNRAS